MPQAPKPPRLDADAASRPIGDTAEHLGARPRGDLLMGLKADSMEPGAQSVQELLPRRGAAGERDLVLATSLVGEIGLSSLAVVNQAVYELDVLVPNILPESLSII